MAGFDRALYRLLRKGELPFLTMAGKTATLGAVTLKVLQYDGDGDALLCTGTTKPVDSNTGFAKGCIFIDTDVGAGTTGIYENVGTNTSCNFDVFAASSTTWDSIGDAGAPGTVNFLTHAQTITATKTNGDMLTIDGQGAFGDVSVVRIQSSTGNPTDGTVLEVVSHDANVDPLVVSSSGQAGALVVGQDGSVDVALNLAVTGTLSAGTFTADAVAAATPDQTLALDGDNTGGVNICSISTGGITLGDDTTIADGKNLTVGEGTLTIDNDSVSENALVITSAGTTAGGAINIVAATTTGNVVSVTADDLGSGGAMVFLDSDNTAADNFYLECYDGAATDLTIGQYGGIAIAGNASTDIITVTAGDVQITAGDIDVDSGIITVDVNTDQTSKIERAQATVTGPVFSVVEQTDTVASGQAALFIDQDSVQATASALEIDTEGAVAIKIDALIAAGDGIKIDVADSYTGQGIVADLGPWLGTTSEGFVDITTDSAATQEVGQAIRVNLQGTGTAGTAVEGKAFHAESQAAAKAGESLVYLDTLTNTALHIDNEGAAADGIKFDVAASYTGQGIVADLGTWLGTTNEGFIDVVSDNAATVPAGQFVRLRQLGTGQHAAAIGGTVLYMEDDATAPAAGTSYVMTIDATNIEAIHVDTGTVLVDETVTATGGISTGNAADSFLKTDTVNITAAAVKTLNGTPVELIATPGADKFIEVVSAVLILDKGTEVFTETDDNLVIQYGTSGDDITAAIEMTGFIDAAADTIMTVYPVHPQAANAAADMINNAVTLYNPYDEIAGNATNDAQLTIKITYRIHTAGLA